MRSLADRFWPRVDKSGECWLWIGAKNNMGYGQIGPGRRGLTMKSAHRVAWEMENGPIPGGLWVLHNCDTPACVRTTHLRLGTRRDNIDDMVSRGRQPALFNGRANPRRGSACSWAKMTPESVVKIRKLCGDGVHQRVVARQFGISQSSVGSIFRRESWASIPEVIDKNLEAPPELARDED